MSAHTLAAEIPIVRAYLHRSLPYHTGAVWENLLGLQVLRTAGQYAQYKVRRSEVGREIAAHVRDLEKDGIAIVENFLEPPHFEIVKSEFENAIARRPLLPYKGGENARLHRTQVQLADVDGAASAISRHFQHNDMLDKIASAVVRRRVTKRAEVHLDRYQCVAPGEPDNDIENILHADLHTATVKMFFYMNDVDAANGAFVYAKGSHRLTLGRLMHEYEFSVRQAKLNRGDHPEEFLIEKRADEMRNIIHPRHRRSMKITETQVCVKANTLVIANNMGFHRRGEFTSDVTRDSVQINYRHLEQPLGRGILSRKDR